MNWPEIIQMQVSDFRGTSGEQALFKKVDQYFLGNPWAATTVGQGEEAILKSSTNFVFPIVETATSVLIPPNPQVSIDPEKLEEEVDDDAAEAAANLQNWSLRTGAWRDELSLAVQSAVKYGRGLVKTTWDAEADRAVSRYIDPNNYFYDKSAVRWSDVRYEFEATVLSRLDVEKKVAAGVYDASVLEHTGDRFPDWMLKDNERRAKDVGYQPWYLIYEMYDRERGEVCHILNDRIILRDKLVYRPYDILTFSFNGANVGGVSEIGLILANQESYNWTESFLLNILRFGIPGILYDSGGVSEEKMGKLLAAPLGSAFGVKPTQGKTIGEMFAPRPIAQVPQGAEDWLAKKRDAISYVSAMSDAMRSQTVGAKTATELAFLEGNTRNRLRPRQSKVDDLTVAVAEKQLLLASKYMRRPKTFRKPGEKDWRVVAPWTVEAVKARFKMVAYSPMETNKAVKLETMRNLQSMLVGNPFVNQKRVTAKMLHLLDEDDLLMTEDELAEQAAAQQAAMAPPGGPAGGPGEALPGETPPVADQPSSLPPRAAAFAETVGGDPSDMPQEPAP